jgi:hypothetical protein
MTPFFPFPIAQRFGMRPRPWLKLSPCLLPGIFAAICALPGHAASDDARSPAIKRGVKPAPNVILFYSIKARQRGFPLSGEGTMSWQQEPGKYSISNEVRASFFGKIQESGSRGQIDEFGLAPLQFTEKRFRKDPTSTRFERDKGEISFSEAAVTYPLKGGEQDRASVIWQLIAQARHSPGKFSAGSSWVYFVAGRRDAEAWTFKVSGNETLETALGKQVSLHLIRLPPPDSQDQQLDIWLAPNLDWYPLRLRFADNDGDFVEQTLEKIEKQ